MRYYIFMLLVAWAFVASAQMNEDILTKQWRSFWISVPGESANGYGVYNFRKTFSITNKPESFVVHVSADNRYKLFVNGTLVSLGPARGDLAYWNFETVDVAKFLVVGENIIAAVVWNFGEMRPEAQISWKTAFILQGNSAREEIVNTNQSWLCVRDSSYQPLRPELLYTYYVAGPGEHIDFNKRDDEWFSAGYKGGSWKNAQQLFQGLPKGTFAWTDGWMLVPRKIPPMELSAQRISSIRSVTGIKVPKEFPVHKTSFEVPAKSKVTILLDQTYLTNAYPVLQFSKGKNAVLKLSYAEALYVKENGDDWRAQKQKGNRDGVEGKRFVGITDQIISSGRENQTFTPLWWRTYRYIQLEIQTDTEPLILNDIYGLFTGYPFEFKASLTTSDQKLGKILDIGWRTARLCANETYMDCPYYEQLQYVGDARIQALVSYFNSGDDRLARNALDLMDHSRMSEGITLSRHPSFNPQQIPTFSLWYVEMLHDYWMYRPDSVFVKNKLQSVRSVLEFFHRYQNEDGLVKNAPYWEFTDWTEQEGWKNGVAPIGENGTSAAVDLQLCLSYRTASRLESALGMQAYAQLYDERYQQLKKSILANYWDGNRNVFSDTKEKKYFSQHVNSLSILADVIEGDQAKLLMEKILNDKSLAQATIYFKYYVHQALSKCGMGDLYLDQLGDWHDQLENGLTTWAEISDHNNARSDCHAWGASPNVEFFRTVLGVDSDAPGFSKIKIEPNPGKLKVLKATVPHPNGAIEVNLDLSKSSTAIITLPEKTSGRFIWRKKVFLLKAGNNTFSLN